MKTAELTRKPAITCEAGTTLAESAELMHNQDVGSVIVLDRGRLRGIATDRDIVVRGLAAGLGPDAPIEAVMTSDVAYITEQDDAWSAATQMATRGCRRLPVLDSTGMVVGIITLDDLISLFATQIDKLAHTVRSELHRHEPVDLG